MNSRRILSISILLLLFAALGTFWKIHKSTEGWNVRIDKTPTTPVWLDAKYQGKPSSIAQIDYEVVCSWDKCPVFSVRLKNNGNSEYIGRRNVDRIGRYSGHFGDFQMLASWISDQQIKATKKQCFDASVSLTLTRDGSSSEYIVCNENSAPRELQQVFRAIEEAAARIQWTKTRESSASLGYLNDGSRPSGPRAMHGMLMI